jgi:LemA protein
MRSKWLVPGIIVGVIVLIIASMMGTYNSLVGDREKVRAAFSNLDSQYQRRTDLVGNLVNTVKGSANFEQDTLLKVTQARSNVAGIKIDENTSQEKLQQYVDAQNQMTGALSRLIAVAENYPDLKTTAAFQDLMSQLEGTENRIQVARSDYNEVARPYNTRLQTVPTVVFANLFGFKPFAYFEASNGAATAPTVDFDNAKQ